MPALESYPDPSQAIKETWSAVEVGSSPGELPRPLSGLEGPPGLLDCPRGAWIALQDCHPPQGPPGLSDGLIVAWVAFQGWRLPPGLLDGLRGVWEAPQG